MKLEWEWSKVGILCGAGSGDCESDGVDGGGSGDCGVVTRCIAVRRQEQLFKFAGLHIWTRQK